MKLQRSRQSTLRILTLGSLAVMASFANASPQTPRSPQGEGDDALLRSSWFAAVSADLERADYAFAPAREERESWSARNTAQGFECRVSASGLEMSPRAGGGTEACEWKLELATRSFGRETNPAELSTASARLAGERIEIDHGRITEWFVNGERGLEQGWTIADRPGGDGRLWIGLELCGDLSLKIDEGGRSGVLVDAGGVTRLRYAELVVVDASGTELDARLASSPDGVGISIDDARAVYPLTVDPLFTSPAWTVEGNQDNARLGFSVASAGDVNGDGYSDVILGAPLASNGQSQEGRAFVYLGSSSGLPATPSWTAESNRAGAWFGYCVATAGDVNCDGYSDVIVGAPNYSNALADSGRAYVYLGSASGLSATPFWIAGGDEVGAHFGYCVATAGDVNGDGCSDVLVSAPWHDAPAGTDTGRVYAFHGGACGGLCLTADWTIDGSASLLLGSSVSTAGDVNGDGFDDVLVGSEYYDGGQTDEGVAILFAGSATGVGSLILWGAEGNQTNARFGHSVSTAGDVNGDGLADVIIGASSYENGQAQEGRAFVYVGSASTYLSTYPWWTMESDQAYAMYGWCVATAGDVNGDGFSDVIVGAPVWDSASISDAGRAYVYLGGVWGIEAALPSWTDEGNQSVSRYGYCVATAGDVNGDGRSDVIIGADLYTNGQSTEGRVSVYRGTSVGLTASPWSGMSGDMADAMLGYSVASAGDVNGDGYGDVIVGAPQTTVAGGYTGEARVYDGSATGLAGTAAWVASSGATGNSYFGGSVASAGDVNGDGFGDVIVGDPNYQGPSDPTRVGRASVYLGSSSGLASSPAWTYQGIPFEDDGDSFGWSVASAGDVNGDGFGDVIVGDPFHKQPPFYLYSFGRALVFYGSASGLSSTPAWTQNGTQDSGLGFSVATAGDVNRDGYSDVLVGSPYFSHPGGYGRIQCFLGSSSGLATSPQWDRLGNGNFGWCVATAGDVNGDSYSDVIACSWNAAFVAKGSSSGVTNFGWLILTPDFPYQNTDPQFGYSAASAGDVNNDGYSDVIVGSPWYTDGETNEGAAFLYLGSSTGLSPTLPAWSDQSDRSDSWFGSSVACAGDVNGDGASDVIVGAWSYDDLGAGHTDAGLAYVWLGNNGSGGRTRALQQRRADGTAPIALLGRSSSDRNFRIRLGLAGKLTGFDWASGRTTKARLEWEVAPLSVPLDGSRIQSGPGQTFTGAPITFDELVPFVAGQRVATGPYHWRARVRTSNPLMPVTPWVSLPGNDVTESKLRAPPLGGRGFGN